MGSELPASASPNTVLVKFRAKTSCGRRGFIWFTRYSSPGETKAGARSRKHRGTCLLAHFLLPFSSDSLYNPGPRAQGGTTNNQSGPPPSVCKQMPHRQVHSPMREGIINEAPFWWMCQADDQECVTNNHTDISGYTQANKPTNVVDTLALGTEPRTLSWSPCVLGLIRPSVTS